MYSIPPVREIRFSSISIKIIVIASMSSAAILLALELLWRTGSHAFMAIGLLCLCAAAVPMLVKKNFSPFEPPVLIAFSVAIGCTFRPIMIASAEEYNYKVDFLIDGMSAGELASAGIFVPLGILLLSLGYIVAGRKRIALDSIHLFRADGWFTRRVYLVVLVFACASLFATYALVDATDVDLTNLAALSVKRTVELAVGGDAAHARLGYLHWMSDMSRIAVLILLVHHLQKNLNGYRKTVASFGRFSLIVTLFGVYVFWPIVSSSRTAILELLFGMTIVVGYLGFKGSSQSRKRKFVWTGSLLVFVALAVLVSIGLWRQLSQTSEIRDKNLTDAVVNQTVGSGNFVPLERTALIIDRMHRPGTEFKLGETYANLIFAPIPRTIWPEKPELSVGLFVKRELYNRPTGTNGYPPGLLGEAFINFGFIGIFIVPAIWGAFLKVFYNSFRPMLQAGNPAAVVLYAAILWPLAFQFLDLDFSLSVMNLATSLIPTLVALMVISRRGRHFLAYRTHDGVLGTSGNGHQASA